MPIYTYDCGEHMTEQRAGTELQAILCPACGRTARRVAVYVDQHIICETGPKYGRRHVRAPAVPGVPLEE